MDEPLVQTRDGVVFAMNGTIKQVNLSQNGEMLKQQLLNDRNSLICVFEDMFGHENKINQIENSDLASIKGS